MNNPNESGVHPRRRIHVTRAFCVLVVAIFMLSSPVWHGAGNPLVHMITPLGIVLAALGALGRLWCTSYAAGNKNQRLITAGPYSLTRNPLYFFSFVGGIGVAITTETLTIPMLFIVWFAWYYRAVIAGEEDYLRLRYGGAFDSYVAAVPRFFPQRSGYFEPQRWEMSPSSFRRSLTEVGWFVITAVVLHTIHDIRTVVPDTAMFRLF